MDRAGVGRGREEEIHWECGCAGGWGQVVGPSGWI